MNILIKIYLAYGPIDDFAIGPSWVTVGVTKDNMGYTLRVRPSRRPAVELLRSSRTETSIYQVLFRLDTEEKGSK